MRRPRSAYEILGLPRSATPVQARARFRQLMRNYRKEMTSEQLLEEERSRAWVRAYLLLTDIVARREYDRAPRERRGRVELPDTLASLSNPDLLLTQAELSFVRGKLKEALERARDVLKLDPRKARGWALAGDILRRQGKNEDALTMYNYAVQYEPQNQLYWESLNEVSAIKEGRAPPRPSYYDRPTVFNRPGWVWVVLGATALSVAGLGVGAAIRPGPPILFGIPKNLLMLAVLGGFLLGLAPALTRVLGPFDDELVWYGMTGLGPGTTPVGLYVIFPGVICFWLALLFYLVMAALDEYFSLSIILALGATALATVGLSFAAGEARNVFLVLGGNFVFFGMLAGWLVGSTRKRVFEH